MVSLKTYSHLMHLGHKPTEYEIVTTGLHYYTSKGFEVSVPVEEWYGRYQKGSPFACSDWEAFGDPQETTYTKYTTSRKAREIFVDGLFRSIEDTGYDGALSKGWLDILNRVLAPMRYPCHGLQMAASYVAQMGPSGRITIAGLLQAADEIRRIQRLAYRMRALQVVHPDFGQNGRALWQSDALWQPWREAIEQLLVTYDWGEAFVALNLVFKPAFDELFLTHFARLAQRHGDDLLSKVFFSLNEDCQWHREWSRALVRVALQDNDANRSVIQGWTERWTPVVCRAVEAFAPVFEEMPEASRAMSHSEVSQSVHTSLVRDWASMGLDCRLC